jgi:hypothetical protein
MINLNTFSICMKIAILCFLCIKVSRILISKINTSKKMWLIILISYNNISNNSINGNHLSQISHPNIMIKIIMESVLLLFRSYFIKAQPMIYSIHSSNNGKLQCKPCSSLSLPTTTNSNQNKLSTSNYSTASHPFLHYKPSPSSLNSFVKHPQLPANSSLPFHCNLYVWISLR